MVRLGSGRDPALPGGDHRYPDPPFVEVSFVPPENPIRVEIVGIGTALLVRTVIGSKHDNCIFIDPKLLEFGNNLTYLVVEQIDHSHCCSMRLRLGTIRTRPVPFTTVDPLVTVLRFIFSPVFFHIFLRCKHLGMRNQRRIEHKKRLVTVLLQELQRLRMNKVRSVLLCLKTFVALQHNFLLVVPQMIRIVVVCNALTVISVKFIKSLEVGVAFRTGITQSPLAECSGNISGILQSLSQRIGFCFQRILTFRLPFPVAANEGVTGVLTGHQRRARGCTNGGAGVMLGELHPIPGQFIDIWCAEQLLPVAA